MKNDQKIYLLGMSGHALSVIDALQSNEKVPLGYFDQLENKNSLIAFLGPESKDKCGEFLEADAILFPSVGSNHLRKKLVEMMEELDYQQTIITHLQTIVSETAKIGLSTFVSAGAIVNAQASIGKAVIINTGAIIEHECVIADFVHIGPGSVLAGAVSIGELSFIGANATVKQGVKIGSNVVIGAGSVVLRDVPDNCVYVGNPAKYLKAND
jgi:sugar O-acyltransferase (sialic acid O-acetyltransferase NeuD family)